MVWCCLLKLVSGTTWCNFSAVLLLQSVSPTEDEVVGADVIFASGADDRWSVFEEDMLLDAVEHHGFGSWLVFLKLKLVENGRYLHTPIRSDTSI